MSPYSQAKQLYIDQGLGEGDFELDCELHCKFGGYMLATPCEFALVRPVCSQWSVLAQCHLEHELALSKYELTKIHDCWHITCVVGELFYLLDWLPYHLPFISMERKGKYKRYETTRIYEIAKTTSSTHSNTSSP